MKRFQTVALALAVALAAIPAAMNAAEEANVEDLIKEFTGQAEAKKRSPQQLQAAYARVVEHLVGGMGAEKASDRRGPQDTLETMCHHAAAPGREPARLALCRAVAARLDAKTPLEARVWMLRMLQHVGRGEVVGPIADLLDDDEARIRECARRALQANTDPEAGKALLAELSSAGKPAWQVALLNALGYRREAGAVDAAGKLLGAKDASVVEAAAAALGKIGGDEAAKALAAARPKADGATRAAVVDAYLRCADGMASAGKTREAGAVYEAIYGSKEPTKARIAALRGLVMTQAEKALPRVIELLKGADAELRGAAVMMVRAAPGASATKAFASALPKLPEAVQVLLLGALADRGDPSARDAVVAAMGSESEAVKLAAIGALADLGDASVVDRLVKLAVAGGKPADAARRSLYRVGGKDVNERLLGMASEGDAKARVEVITALGQRRCVGATGALLKAARDEDAAIRRAAVDALGLVATEKEVPAMVDLLVGAKAADEAQAVEKAILTAAGRIGKDKCAGPVLAAAGKATGETRCTLVRLLGRIGGPKALAAVADAVDDADGKVRNAAIRSLSGMKDPAAAEPLLKVARSAKEDTHKVLALRGYVGLAREVGRHRRGAEKAVKMLAEAMKLAARPEERKMVLGALGGLRQATPAALEMVVGHVGDKAVGNEAGAAALRLINALRKRHKKEALAGARRVAAEAANKKHRAEAEKIAKALQPRAKKK